MKIETDRGKEIATKIAGLRKRAESVRKTILDFAMALGEELKIDATPEQILAGLDIENGTVTFEDQTDA